MRTAFLVPAAAMAIALSLSEPGGPADSTLPKETRLERASRLLLDDGRTDADARAALLALLDETIAAAPTTRLAGAWAKDVGRARRLLAGEPPDNDGALRLLDGSYREATGKSWRMPGSVSRIEDAKSLARRQLGDATRALREGRADEAVHLLLETVLLVLTPVLAPAARS